MSNIAEGNQLLALIDRMRGAFVGRDEIVQRGADVTKNTNTTGILNGVVTPMSFNTVTKDTDTLWSAGQPTRLTARVQGWYVLSGGTVSSMTAGAAAGVECIMSIRRGGATNLAVNNAFTVVGKNVYINVARVIYLNSGDYIELTFQHDGAGTTMQVFGNLGYSPQLSMVRYP